METSGTGGYSYYANYYGLKVVVLTLMVMEDILPTRFTGNHTSYDNGTVANYHTSGSRYNTSISLDLWMETKIGWGADSPSYMTPQTYSFLGGGYATSSDLRNRSLWKGFLKTEWTTIYIQHTAMLDFLLHLLVILQYMHMTHIKTFHKSMVHKLGHILLIQ